MVEVNKAGGAGADIVKRMSARTIMGSADAIRQIVYTNTVNDGDTVDLFNVYGIAFDLERGDSDYGPWIAILGSFEAENLHTGELVRATKLFVPDVVTNLLAGVLKSRDGVQSAELSFCIVAKRDKSAATGYVYIARSLLPPSADDPLEKMRARLAALPGYENRHVKALPAPDQAKGGKQAKA